MLDVIVNIQPSDVLVSVGDKTQFTCNFTGQHRVRREKVTWLKGKHIERRKKMLKLRIFFFPDGKPIQSDSSHITTAAELPNATVTILHIIASRPSDSGSYRCSDGSTAHSREAKLYLRDGPFHTFLRSLATSSSSMKFDSSRTVFCLLIFLLFSFLLK